MKYRLLWLYIIFIQCSVFSLAVQDQSRGGFLEEEKGQLILHLKGTPYEMGCQHGVLLKSMIQQMVEQFIDGKKPEAVEQRFADFEKVFSAILSYIPKEYLEEMEGLAKGSEVPLKKIQMLNLFPEMFHCSGIVALPKSTADGDLYHVRVLDYGVGRGLEKASVLMVFEPSSGYPFLSVSYPGFVGVITGMNEQKISLGEIGGLGYGKWDGCPMSFLMRLVLERASTVKEAQDLFAGIKRTCEYYYLIADGKNLEAVALYAVPDEIQAIEPGNSYTLIQNTGVGLNEKIVISPFSWKTSQGLSCLHDAKDRVQALFFQQPENSLILTGYPKPERFSILFERFMDKQGSLTLLDMEEMIKPPVTCETNLHNAIFKPSALQVTISHAKEKSPASEETYHTYSLKELLQRDPIKKD